MKMKLGLIGVVTLLHWLGDRAGRRRAAGIAFAGRHEIPIPLPLPDLRSARNQTPVATPKRLPTTDTSMQQTRREKVVEEEGDHKEDR